MIRSPAIPNGRLDLAQEAAALLPNSLAFRNTLGVAHYRAGNWKAAVEALEKSRQLTAYSKDSVILFFLSMAHGRLNEKEQARTFFDQAAQWRMGIGVTEEELRRLCAEAAALLGLEVPPTLERTPGVDPWPSPAQTRGRGHSGQRHGGRQQIEGLGIRLVRCAGSNTVSPVHDRTDCRAVGHQQPDAHLVVLPV